MLVKTTSKLYSALASIKNALYDRSYLDSYRPQRPVISIGNLTMGGTGKTPLVNYILDLAATKSLKPVVISRNYKAQKRNSPIMVDIHVPHAPFVFGDEPVFIACKYPEVSVVVGPSKWRSAFWYEQNHNPPDFYLIDDGFQHRSLSRDLDIVLVDVSKPLSELNPIPEGRARESYKGASRADVIVFTKTNYSSEELIASYKELFKDMASVYELEQLTNLNEKVCEPVLAISGLGDPKSFEKALKIHGVEPLRHMIFSDHYMYTPRDVKNFENFMLENSCSIITTEKDRIKLLALGLKPKYFVSLKCKFKTFPKEIHEFFDKII